jgi:Ca2+-binding RTX toxin-like protein
VIGPFGPATGTARLVGGLGDDVLTGGEERTLLEGGPGADILSGGLGADRFSGGEGVDLVTYGAQFAFVEPVRVVFVSLNGKGPDGAVDERDRILGDVEDVAGGERGDELIGGAGPNALTGDMGDDDITGGGGRDLLLGGDGDDRIRSRDGRRDVVACGAGNGDRAFADPRDDVGVECERVQVRRARRR